MKLLSFEIDGVPRVGIAVDDTIVPLQVPAGRGTSPMRRLLLEHGHDLAASIGALSGEPIPRGSVTVLPLVPDPGKVVAAPVNYVDHQAEMQEDAHIDSLGVFLKAPTSVLAHGGTVRLPYTDRRFDQEGELAVVIGRRASHVSASEALDHVAGYTLLLDMTMRGGEDRSTRKSFDTFTPVGPHLVTPDEAGGWEKMRLRTWVAGELRQDADVVDLIWGIPALIEYASSVMTLEPGDIVTSGTPAGIGQVREGDAVAVEVEGVGRLEVRVTEEGAVPCPTKGAGRGPRPPETVTPVRQRA
ncbi:fumarylacetoacetate hydrolase family protein [Herbiconiux sp. KACC 21604]|uniref:fumarylacetoacetate hydrolase family protein n=1 Tax=unclassified Herbiconiux TaxID=2618217 RepID=UPI0014925A40|nr:fumarylacetoacetate hydrolase family protein [Herbiconiux sp. SALV-R1]QJU55323.1 fumarylacetoacetate hydrolase family protein [Herbiconiux sp. SALV-R1]WPO86491.1 fumarylacetoacetate hydrolase family protein [Herbiconiux sp. KACC 21604]